MRSIRTTLCAALDSPRGIGQHADDLVPACPDTICADAVVRSELVVELQSLSTSELDLKHPYLDP